MKKFFPGIIFCFCIVTVSFFFNKAAAQAQGIIVQGKITDSDNKPVHGVTVAEIDADGRTIKADRTDVNGNFSFRLVNKNHKLTISHISYKSLELNIGDRTVFNLTLESSARELGDVVIVSQRKADNGMVPIAERNLSTSQSHISAKEMEEMQATSIDQALQGRLPGVDITASSGDPGAGMQIRIRGTSSINNSNDPLIVVDGMPYETSIPSDFNFGSADDAGYAQLLNLPPADIQDITILKDAAATAVWGSRAAGGVVVITTKRGRIGKPVLSYTLKSSITKQPSAIPMLNGDQYSTLIPEMFMNATGTPLPQSTKEFQYDPNDPYWYYNYSRNTDWLGAITRTGHAFDHTLSMNGGGDKTRYYASLGYSNWLGTTLGTDFNRINTKINLDYNVSQKIKIRSDFSYSFTNTNKNYVNNLRDIAYRKMPNMSIYEYDEFGNNTGNYFSPASNIQGSYVNTGVLYTFNPVAMANDASNNVINQRVTPHFTINYSIVKSLQAFFDVQFDINNTKYKTFLPQTATGRFPTEPSVNRAQDGDLDEYNVITKTNLVYTPKFKNEKHSLIAFMVFQTNDKKGTTHEVLTTNTASSVLQDPSSPSRAQGTESKLQATQYERRSASVVLDGTYLFADKYILHAGIRGDGNSGFGPDHRYGLFPSLSGAWRISSENFMKRFKFIDDLKLRVSYGASGNEPKKNYGYFGLYNALITAGPSSSVGSAFSYLGQGGIYPSNPQLLDLRWETVIGRNLGFDFSLLNKRIGLTLDFYKNTTKDLFLPGLQVSSFTGFNSIDLNVGTLQNQGFEMGINTTPVKTKNWQVDLNFNIASNENVVTEISPLYPSTKGDITQNGTYETFLKVNNPFGSFYGFKFKGVYPDRASTIATDAKGQPIVGPNGQVVYMNFNYPSIGYQFQPGDAMYEDINHDGNINYQDVVYLGNSNPKFTGGFGGAIVFKGRLRLSTFFNYRYKYDVINGTKINNTNMSTYNNQSTAVLRRWHKEGDVTDMPRPLYRTGYNWLGSDRYVEDASFLRFRTLTLRYTAGKKFAEKTKLKNTSIYVTVENLYVWTNYTGQDPEVSARGSDLFRIAVDQSFTPPAKTFTLGIFASF